MLLVIALILFVIWIVAVVTKFVVGGLIHIVLLLAVISAIAHLFTHRRAV